MEYALIETNWILREKHKGINEHYKSLKQACESIEGAKLIGLYRPLNELWHWTSFTTARTLEEWRSVDRESNRLNPDFDDNVSYTMSRIYIGNDQGKQPPPIRDPESLKYLVLTLGFASDAVGIRDLVLQRYEQFEGLEDAGILGVFQPMTESWNYALVKMHNTMRRYTEIGQEWRRTYPHIPEITSSIERIYERYEP